jgi:endonuclease-3 related protein
MPSRRKQLLDIYDRLLKAYGPQHWWPGESPLEVAVGAVLTQNAAWTNVARAISNLKAEGLLDEPGAVARLLDLPADRLEYLIHPCGFFRVKGRRLRALLQMIQSEFGGAVERMAQAETEALRERLLAVRGVGPETADSILLYALDKPVFVVDAYTKRVAMRHNLCAEEDGYVEVQALFSDALPADAALFNEYHALLVRVGKERCRPRKPLCPGCPLQGL